MTSSADDAGPPAALARSRRRVRSRARALRARRAAEIARRESRLLVAIGLLGAGIVLVTLGWYGAAHTNILTEQIPYLISGGLLGLGLIIVAGIVASSAAIERDNRALREDIANALAAMGRTASAAAASGDDRAFSVPGGRSYHLAGCPILEGKNGVRETTRVRAAAAGLAQCKLCGPD